MIRRLILGAAVAGLGALAGCAEPEAPTQAERLSALIGHRLGRHVVLRYVETEPDGVHATCGYAGDPPGTPAPGESYGRDVIFIWAQGSLALSSERPDFDDLRTRNCPSLPYNATPGIPKTLAP